MCEKTNKIKTNKNPHIINMLTPMLTAVTVYHGYHSKSL